MSSLASRKLNCLTAAPLTRTCWLDKSFFKLFLDKEGKLLSKKTDMPVYIAENPMESVVKGTEKTLDDLENLRNVLIDSRRR